MKSEGSYSGFATSCCGLEAGQGRDNLSTATSFGSLSFRGEGIELSRSSPYATPLTPGRATFRSKENLPQPPGPQGETSLWRVLDLLTKSNTLQRTLVFRNLHNLNVSR